MTRIPRQRVFTVSVQGLEDWTEPAGERCGIELQHRLATEKYRGKLVRVVEKYLGGAKAPRPRPKDDDLTEEEDEQ